MKTIFKIFAALLVVIVIAIAAVVITFDPNAYKTQITEAVEQQTGRTLTIDGKIALSLFPWVGLEVGKLSLSNANGFSKAEFARMDQLDIKIKLLPLLASNIEIDKIRLHGLFVSLETHKDGKTNWQDLAQSESATTEAEPVAVTPATSDEPAASFQLAGFMVNGIELVDANLQWLDDQAGSHAKISKLNLETGAIKFDEWIPVKFSTHINSTEPELDASIKLDTRIKINQALNVFDVQGFALDVNALMKSVMAERMALSVNLDARADLQAQKVELSKLTLSALGASINAKLAVSNLDTQPKITGTLSGENIRPRELATKLGITLPESRDSWALSELSFKSAIQASAEAAKLDQFELVLDKSKLSGFVHIDDIATPAIRYQLALDAIDLDAYLPAPVEPVVEPVPPVAAVPEDVVIDLPLEFLRKLELDGEMKIASLRITDIAISDMLIKTTAAKGIIKLDPLSMKLLDGSFTTSVSLDARSTPVYHITAKASDVKPAAVVNPLLVGMLGNQELALEGVMQMDADITTRGDTLNTLKKEAVGPVNISMGHTSVTGVDIVYYLRNAVASYAEAKKIPVKEGFRGSYTPKEKTAFDKVIISAKLANGIVNNDQFLMDSKRLKVNGGGTINILNNSLDEKITVQLDAGSDKTTVEKILQKPLGVHIHGPFAAPAIDVDYASLGKAIGGMLTDESKEKIQQKTDALKEESKAKVEAAKQKLQEQEDAKKAALEQKAKDSVKEKTKDKLKGLFNR